MILALKVILIVMMSISFLGTVGEPNKDSRNTMAALCIASMLSLVVSFIYL